MQIDISLLKQRIRVKSIVDFSTKHFNASISVDDLSSSDNELSVSEYFVEESNGSNLSVGDASNVVDEDSSLLGLIDDQTLRDLLVPKEVSLVCWEVVRALQQFHFYIQGLIDYGYYSHL
jgi:hypothetical protein